MAITNKTAILDLVTGNQIRSDFPQFKSGDTLRVFVKIKEGNKERIQIFEGICIKKSGRAISQNFTVRKISYGIGVERTFQLHSPTLVKIMVLKEGIVRRAKLYYLRHRSGKQARIKEKKKRITK